MPRKIFRCVLPIVLLLAVTSQAAWAAPTLTVKEARGVAASKARHIKHQMADNGARRAAVPACQLKGVQAVLCVITVSGHDAENDFRWKCWMPLTVRRAQYWSGGNRRYRVRYGQAVCA